MNTQELPDGAAEFIDNFYTLSYAEWFPSPMNKSGTKRLTGDTAAGQGVETLLKIAVNNSTGPDIPRGRIECKAGRVESSCDTTLFTKAPSYGMKNRLLVNEFGYEGKEPGEKRLMISLRADSETQPRQNGPAFKISPTDEMLCITADDVVVQGWHKHTLMATGDKKLGGMLAHFKCLREFREDIEWFKISELNLYWGYRPDLFWNHIRAGKITIEPRIKISAAGKARDRGTAFRISDPSAIYDKVIKLL